MKKGRRKKKGMAVLLASFVIFGMLQVIPESVLVTQAAEGNTPSVTTYATKIELMNSFQQDGNNPIIGKIAFGKDSNGNLLEWYVLGLDNGVKGDNVSIFAESPITTGQTFEADGSVVKDFHEGEGVYITNPSQINPNHYGASDFRRALQNLATDTRYFTTQEQSLMQATTITNYDTFNKVEYITTDVLYALKGDDSGDTRLWAGSNNDKILPLSIYWSGGESFWLRPPNNNTYVSAFYVDPSYEMIRSVCVDLEGAVRPASNLNLSSVIFASAATVASDVEVSGTIAENTPMTLRLDGSNTSIGTVVYDSTQGILITEKSSSAIGTVAIVVQGNDGGNNWYYSKVVNGREQMYVSDITKALSLSSEVDLSDCEIWLETTIDDMIYANHAILFENNKSSDDGKALYRVTFFDAENGTATYITPTNKKQKTVKIPDTVVIDGITYRVTAIENNAFSKNKYVEKVTIGKNVKTIGKNAFYNCTKLENVKFGSNVRIIGEKAFYKCTVLKKISLPSKVTTIGKRAFKGCKKVTSVTIGRKVDTIGSEAFYGCNKVKTLTIQSTKLTQKMIGGKAFSKTPKSMMVKIPKKKFKAYKSMLIKSGVNKKVKFKKN